MNNSQLFKAAHKQARLTVDAVGDYQIAFTLALRELIAENKKPVNVLTVPTDVDTLGISNYCAVIMGLVMLLVSVKVYPIFAASILAILLGGAVWFSTVLVIESIKWLMSKFLKLCFEEITTFEDAIQETKVFKI